MGLESVLTARHRFVRMAGVGIHRRDDPVRGHPLRDTPPSVGAIRSLDRLDVLAGDQRQQRHRVGRFGPQFLLR